MDLGRTLVIAEGQLGDLLLLVPALRALKAANTTMHLTVLVVRRRPGPPAVADTNPLLPEGGNPLLPEGGHTGTPRVADAGRLSLDSGYAGTVGATKAGPLVHPGSFGGTSSVLKHLPYVDRVLELDRLRLRSLRGLARLRGEWEVIRSLRRERFDAVICTFPEDRFVLWAKASGARRRVGQYAQPLRRLLTDTPHILKEDLGVLRYYLALAAVLGAKTADERTEFAIPDSSRVWAREFIAAHCPGTAPLVIINPGASGEYRIWPPERFSALLSKLRANGVRVILCGGPMDDEVMEAVTTVNRSAVPVARMGPDLTRDGALFAESDLVVTNDSGPRHLAVAVGARSLAVIQRHHHREWGVYPETDSCVTVRTEEECPVCPRGVCQDSRRDGERFGSVCMRMVSVETVYDRVMRMLSVSSSGTPRTSSGGMDQPARA
jgi:ADP-heptose:LPS heptosyltransferase